MLVPLAMVFAIFYFIVIVPSKRQQKKVQEFVDNLKVNDKVITTSGIYGQIMRLEEVFGLLNEKVQGKHCDGIAGIIEEGKSVMEEDFEDTTMDACLIAAGQRAEHYEMAAYGTLVAWARAMGHDDVADLLEQTLDEEKAADEKLTSIAESGVNQEAADAVEQEEDDAVATRGSAPKKGATSTVKKRSSRR